MAQLLRASISGTGLLLRSGATGKSVTVPTTTPVPGAITVTPTIASRSPTQALPETIHIDIAISGQDASATVGADGYDARLHDVEYLVDGYYVGSANSYSFSAPAELYSGSARHTDGHKNSRFQYTPKAAFTYRVAGTYTVRVYAYEPSSMKFGFADLTFTVGSQDAAYPTTQTVYADPSGVFSDAPTGCQTTTVSNLATLFSTYVSGASSRVRILLAAGQNFTMPAIGLGSWYGMSFNGLCIDRRGAGANPAISVPTNAFIDYDDRGTSNTDKEVIIANCDFTGPYDDATTGADISAVIRFINTTHARYFVMDACTVRGTSYVWGVTESGESDPENRHISFNDVDMEECSYGSLSSRSARYTITGCRLHSSPTSIVNSTQLQGWGDRIEGAVVLYHSCSYYRDQGWTQVSSNYTAQPCMRFGTKASVAVNGDEYYVCASILEGPGNLPPIQFLDGNGAQEKPVNAIISKCVILGGYGSETIIQSGSSGGTFRDNLLINPNAVNRLFNPFTRWFKFEGNGTSATNQAPIKIYNNTLVNYLDGNKNRFGFTGPAAIYDNSAGFTGIISNNNVTHQTRTISPDITYAPLQDATNQFSLSDTGYSDVGLSGDQSSVYVSSVATGELDWHIPETGSSAIGGAFTGLRSDSDFFGVRRDVVLSGLSRSAPSSGAFEPNLES